jgi:hypothetical protein
MSFIFRREIVFGAAGSIDSCAQLLHAAHDASVTWAAADDIE